jgi:hypothetical protein
MLKVMHNLVVEMYRLSVHHSDADDNIEVICCY